MHTPITGNNNVSMSYLMFKSFMAFYMVAALAWSFAYRQLGTWKFGWTFFLYYTHWSYIILVVWAVLDFGLVVYRFNLQARGFQDPFWNQGDECIQCTN